MQLNATSESVPEQAQAGCGRMSRVIDIRRITDEQISSRSGIAGPLPMALSNGVKCNFGTMKKTVGRLEVRPIVLLRQ
jgi:hypothetical protein